MASIFADPNIPAAPVTQDDWNAVKAEVAGDTQATTTEVKTGEAPAQAAAATEATPPAQEVAADPYAGLTPEVRAKLEGFDRLMEEQPKLLNALKETQGRVSALQSEFAKQRQAQPAVAPTQTAIAAAAKDPEKWSALKKDFPEWGDGITEFVDARLAALGRSGVSPEQLEAVVAQRVGSATEALAGRVEEMLIETKYQTWRDIVKQPDFETWFKAQKPEVQALSQSPRGVDALRMLDLFSEAKAKPVAQVRQSRQQVLAAAVQGKPAAPTATKTVADMTPTELWKYEAELRRKRNAA